MTQIEICNIWKCQCYVIIKDDEVLCPRCRGQGAKYLNASFKQRHFDIVWCKLCLGEGKVDWIRSINKQEPVSGYGYLPYTHNVKKIKMRCIGPKHCKKKLKRIWINQKRFIDPYDWNFFK